MGAHQRFSEALRTAEIFGVSIFLGRSEAESFLDEFAEAYTARRRTDGFWHALAWYWFQVIGGIAPLARYRRLVKTAAATHADSRRRQAAARRISNGIPLWLIQASLAATIGATAAVGVAVLWVGFHPSAPVVVPAAALDSARRTRAPETTAGSSRPASSDEGNLLRALLSHGGAAPANSNSGSKRSQEARSVVPLARHPDGFRIEISVLEPVSDVHTIEGARLNKREALIEKIKPLDRSASRRNPAGPAGLIDFTGSEGVPVLVGGVPLGKVPLTLQLPPGAYSVRTVRNGSVVHDTLINVADSSRRTFHVSR